MMDDEQLAKVDAEMAAADEAEDAAGNPLLVSRPVPVVAAESWFKQDVFAGIGSDSEEDMVRHLFHLIYFTTQMSYLSVRCRQILYTVLIFLSPRL